MTAWCEVLTPTFTFLVGNLPSSILRTLWGGTSQKNCIITSINGKIDKNCWFVYFQWPENQHSGQCMYFCFYTFPFWRWETTKWVTESTESESHFFVLLDLLRKSFQHNLTHPLLFITFLLFASLRNSFQHNLTTPICFLTFLFC